MAGPLRDRFGFVGRLDHYDVDELQAIVTRSAGILGVPIDAEGARRIAERSRGTPRIANRLLRRVRDFVEVRAEGTITSAAAVAGLEVFGVDELGLDKVDRSILDVLCRRFAGRPVGLTTLAQCIGEEPDTIEDAYEPYLLQQGLLQRTTRGRVAAPGPGPTSGSPRSSRRCSERPGRTGPPGAGSADRRTRRSVTGSATMVAMSELTLGPGPSGRPDSAGVPMDAYDYGLPDAAIAQEPIEPRSAARLLVGPGLSGSTGSSATPPWPTCPGCCGPGTWWWSTTPGCCRPDSPWSRPAGAGPRCSCSNRWTAAAARVGGAGPAGSAAARPHPAVRVGLAARRWWRSVPLRRAPRTAGAWSGCIDPTVVERAGTMPLPPYIHRPLGRSRALPDRVLDDRGTWASGQWPRPPPDCTSPRSFSHACRRAGATIVRVDLAIGLDTFRPITAPTAEEHVIHSERYSVPAETMAACAAADRVVAVGTTAVRALESAAATGALAGRTDLYIHGDFRFRVVDVLVTNFHLPRSSLLLLVEAFCGPGLAAALRHGPGRGVPVPVLRRRHGGGPAGPDVGPVRGMNPVRVEVAATDGAARTGTVRTGRGAYPTPAFMPVGTRGAVKALDSADLEALGAEVVLANTYHLMLRPGADTVAALGGLHRFTGWTGHTLTDSGGYQVHSLRPGGRRRRGDLRLGLRRHPVAAHPRVGRGGPGTDRGGHPDGARRLRHPAGVSPTALRVAVDRTAAWAGGPGVTTGVSRPGPRARPCSESSRGAPIRRCGPRAPSAPSSLEFDGYGIGGLSVGEPRPAMLEALAATVPHLPADRPRYLMGVGDPVGLMEAVALGVDQFDCVAPTRRPGTDPC